MSAQPTTLTANPLTAPAVPPTFLDRATALVERGFAVIPLLPKDKSPNTAIGSGATRRTRDKAIISAWANLSPDGNAGVCSDDRITILESDDEKRFRELIKSVAGRDLPETLTSQARENRPHWFFKQTDKSRAVSGSPAVQGLFEWRHENQYVVGAGSIHPSGVPYRITKDVPIADMPDWLVDALLQIRDASDGERNAASSFVKVGAAGVCKQAYLSKYEMSLDKMLADLGFELEVGPGERHYFLNSMAGILHDGTRDEDQLATDLIRLRDAYCAEGERTVEDEELRNLAEWALRRAPCDVEPANLLTTSLFPARAKEVATELVFSTPKQPYTDYDFVLNPLSSKADGWFPLGDVSLVGGASGSGKTRLIWKILSAQLAGEKIFGHVTNRYPFLVIAADRGRRDNARTLRSMDINPATSELEFLPLCYGREAAQHIIERIENAEAMPKVVFIEGGDMLAKDAADAVLVARFLKDLATIADYFNLSIICSVGTPKRKVGEGYTAKRDAIFGSQVWARMTSTIATLEYVDGDDTDDRRLLCVLSRNAKAEKFSMRFNGPKLEEEPAGVAPQKFTWTDFLTAMDGKEFTQERVMRLLDITQGAASKLLAVQLDAGDIECRERKEGRTYKKYYQERKVDFTVVDPKEAARLGLTSPGGVQ